MTSQLSGESTTDPQAAIQRIIDAFYSDDRAELAAAFTDLCEWSTQDGFKPTISQGAELVAIADAFEEWANYEIQEVKFVLCNGWDGDISSMTYAVQSSGELTRGNVADTDQTQLEWIVSLWSAIYSELSDCVKIASKALEANNANECHNCEECQGDEIECDECNFDVAANDYDELYEFDQIAEKLSDFGDWLVECCDHGLKITT